VCACDAGQLIFEMPMGDPVVLFPTEERWNAIVIAPHWAASRRKEILAELETWCTTNGIPLVITPETLPTAWVHAPLR
jgi:hypothetical protein